MNTTAMWLQYSNVQQCGCSTATWLQYSNVATTAMCGCTEFVNKWNNFCYNNFCFFLPGIQNLQHLPVGMNANCPGLGRSFKLFVDWKVKQIPTHKTKTII